MHKTDTYPICIYLNDDCRNLNEILKLQNNKDIDLFSIRLVSRDAPSSQYEKHLGVNTNAIVEKRVDEYSAFNIVLDSDIICKDAINTIAEQEIIKFIKQ